MGLRTLTLLTCGAAVGGCTHAPCGSGPAALDAAFEDGAVISASHFEGAATPAIQMRVSGSADGGNLDVESSSDAVADGDGWVPLDVSVTEFPEFACMFAASVSIALVDSDDPAWMSDQAALTLVMGDLEDSATVALVDDVRVAVSWRYWIH